MAPSAAAAAGTPSSFASMSSTSTGVVGMPPGGGTSTQVNGDVWVYDIDGKLFGMVVNGAVVWPIIWPPGGPAVTMTPLPGYLLNTYRNGFMIWAPTNLRLTQQANYGGGTYTTLSKLPRSTQGHSPARFTSIPDNTLVGCGGASPCILLLVVNQNSVLTYHFNTSHSPRATLNRDKHLIGNGAHVLLGGGDNTTQSNLTLGAVIKFLNLDRPDLNVDGLVDSGAIYVDNEGNYFTTEQSIRMLEK